MRTEVATGPVFEMVILAEDTKLPSSVPSNGVTRHATRSPLLKSEPVRVADVTEITDPLTSHWVLIVTESPSASEVGPGVQRSVDCSYAGFGVRLTLATVGTVFPIVTGLDLMGVPESVPSVGVASHSTLSLLEKLAPVKVDDVAVILPPLTYQV
tara:strand:- start:142 stop:606 length:465 start_codon:yes stop_codon:yes gene_type:complete